MVPARSGTATAATHDPWRLPAARAAMSAILSAVRPHQWVKNLLVFAAPLAAHRIADGATLVAACIAFVAMTLAASAVYVVNDIVDREADRAHPRKRQRAIASGALPLAAAWVLAAVLAVAAAALAWRALPPAAGFWIAAYAVLAFAYSAGLKRQPIVDVLALAALYTLRIMAGGAATGLPVSPWLLSFAMFVFFGLALLKRYVELADPDVDATTTARARGYRGDDRIAVGMLGIGGGFMAVVILALYVSSADVVALYARPAWLWGLCVLLCYWECRAWLIAFRGDMHDDPVAFALTDPVSLVVAAAMAACVVAAI
ncbi:MAG: UbiA family prenyltransferase [Proteobacteria bacterium]|nr:UbiA family prenyltransferase [Pseudomonadota bacterium]